MNMDEKQFKQLITHLTSIDSKLSILIALQKSVSKIPDLGAEENTVFKLCNGKNSVSDIMRITKKTRSTVESTLSHLRKKGLIKTATMNNKISYVKT